MASRPANQAALPTKPQLAWFPHTPEKPHENHAEE
jgi:hypothetical protein